MKLFEPGDEPTDAEVREFVKDNRDAMVLRTTGARGHNVQTIHIPAEEGGLVPMCNSAQSIASWLDKPVSIYPEGNKDWCTRCKARTWPDRAAVTIEVDR